MRARQLAAECFGTFCLVFAGTGAVVVDQVSGGAVTPLGVSLTFGLIVLALIYALGEVSGCHINSAVTLGFWAAGRFPARSVVPYILAQCTGAILASLVLRLMFPTATTLGGTTPAGGDGQSFVMEFILTMMLMVVVLGVSSGSKETGALAGVAVGGLIALEAIFGGPVSGASMNPARSLGPALVSLQMKSLWIYIVAPVAGAIAGVVVDRCIRGPGSTGPAAGA
jgi:aquaporin NIP